MPQRNSHLRPHAESPQMTARSKGEEVEAVHANSFDSRKIAESAVDTLRFHVDTGKFAAFTHCTRVKQPVIYNAFDMHEVMILAAYESCY